jgi:adenylate kinase
MSTGDALRAEVAAGSSLGKQVADLMANGELVDDSLLFECVSLFMERFKSLNKEILVIDGVPRKASQVSILNQSLERAGCQSKVVVHFDADRERLFQRLVSRSFCGHCGAGSTHAATLDLTGLSCGSCGKVGSLTRRKDDDPGVIGKRLDIFYSAIDEIMELYRNRIPLVSIEGGADIEKVYASLAGAIVGAFRGCS